MGTSDNALADSNDAQEIGGKGSVIPDFLKPGSNNVQSTTIKPKSVSILPTSETVQLKKPVESQLDFSTEIEVPLEKKNKKLYAFGIVLFILTFVSTITIFVLRSQITTVDSNVTPNPSATPVFEVATPVPTVTPQALALDREDIKLEILNGSGVSGLAGKTATIFKDLGYEIGTVGNTDLSTENKLYIRSGLTQAELKNLMEDVKSKLQIQTVTEEISDLDVDARIVLGS